MAPARPLGATPAYAHPPPHQGKHHPDCCCHRLILPVVKFSVHRVTECELPVDPLLQLCAVSEGPRVTQGSSLWTCFSSSMPC